MITNRENILRDDWDDILAEQLRDPEFVAQYLTEYAADGTPEEITQAVRRCMIANAVVSRDEQISMIDALAFLQAHGVGFTFRRAA